jgi:hypothetical protein
MSNITLGGLTLCRNDKAGAYKWIRADVSPQGWNPVSADDLPNTMRMPVLDEPYIKEVDFK